MSKLEKALIGHDQLEDPRLLDLPRGVRLLHLEAIVWAALHKTDGAVSRGALRRFTDEEDAALAAAQLVNVGVWSNTDAGWQIVDYLRDQISAQEAEQTAVRNAAKWRTQKERQRKHLAGDHGSCHPKYCSHASVHGADNQTDNRTDNRGSDRIGPVRSDAPNGAPMQITSADRPAPEAAPPPPTKKEAATALRSLREALAFDSATGRWVETSGPQASGSCDNYKDHRSKHRKTAAGWQCDVCHPKAAASQSVPGNGRSS